MGFWKRSEKGTEIPKKQDQKGSRRGPVLVFSESSNSYVYQVDIASEEVIPPPVPEKYLKAGNLCGKVAGIHSRYKQPIIGQAFWHDPEMGSRDSPLLVNIDSGNVDELLLFWSSLLNEQYGLRNSEFLLTDDEQQLFFTAWSYEYSTNLLFVADLFTGEMQPVEHLGTRGAGFLTIDGYGPDNQILLSASEEGETKHYFLDPESLSLRIDDQVYPTLERMHPGGVLAGQQSFTADDMHAYIIDRTGSENRLKVVDLLNEEVSDISPTGKSGTFVWSLSISPDRKKLAFAADYAPDHKGKKREVYVMSVDGTDLRRMSYENGMVSNVYWIQ